MRHMVKVRRVLLWVTLVGSVNLAQLSALSAFIGEAKAWVLFNSVPLMLAWLALTGMLIAGLVLFPRLVRCPGLLAMHVGCVLTLLGGMLGSKAGMKIMDAWRDHKRVFKGAMQLYDGRPKRNVTDEREQQFDVLPFEVRCERCWIEYYPYEHKLSVQVTETVKTGRWESVTEHAPHDGDHSGPDHAGHVREVFKEKLAVESEVKRFKWKLNAWRDLPLTDGVKIRVTGFRIQEPVTEPFLLLPSPSRHAPPRKVPARVGQQFGIGSSHAGMLVGRIRARRWVRWEPHPTEPGQIRLVPDDRPGGSPAVVVEESLLRGRTYVYTQKIADGLGKDAVLIPARYVPQAEAKKATGAEQPGPVIVTPLRGHDKPLVVPAEVGQDFTFMPTRSGTRRLIGRIRKLCFVRLESDPDSPEKRRVIEAEGSEVGAEPAVEIDVVEPRRTENAYAPGVTARLRKMGQPVSMVYIPADDPQKMRGMQRPVITFEVTRRRMPGIKEYWALLSELQRGGGPDVKTFLRLLSALRIRTGEKTITISKGRPSPPVALDFLYDSQAQWDRAGRPYVFAADKPPVKEYNSLLVIRKDDREVARSVIEVNHPMHYGGYHFYQSGFDEEDLAYTYISVKSDAGWLIALIGVLTLMGGTFLHFWVEPVWRAAKGRRGGSPDEPGSPAVEGGG